MCLFCQVCFFPRLQQFILTQEWNDPKSKLQQCCLTLRTLNGGEPDIPCYKVRLNTVSTCSGLFPSLSSSSAASPYTPSMVASPTFPATRLG